MYSTEPGDWAPDRSRALQDDIAALPKVAVTRNADGTGTIETYSVRYDWPVRTGIIIGRLDSDDSRFLAITEDEGAGGVDERQRSARHADRGEVDGRRHQPRFLGLIGSGGIVTSTAGAARVPWTRNGWGLRRRPA